MSSSSVGKPVLPSISANTPDIVDDETMSAISAAKPDISTILTSPDVLSKLKGNSSHADADQLPQDLPVLQEWTCATRPSNKVRDAMMKQTVRGFRTRWWRVRQVNCFHSVEKPVTVGHRTCIPVQI